MEKICQTARAQLPKEWRAEVTVLLFSVCCSRLGEIFSPPLCFSRHFRTLSHPPHMFCLPVRLQRIISTRPPRDAHRRLSRRTIPQNSMLLLALPSVSASLSSPISTLFQPTGGRLAFVWPVCGPNFLCSIRVGDTIGEHTVFFAGPGERIELVPHSPLSLTPKSSNIYF